MYSLVWGKQEFGCHREKKRAENVLGEETGVRIDETVMPWKQKLPMIVSLRAFSRLVSQSQKALCDAVDSIKKSSCASSLASCDVSWGGGSGVLA